MFERVAGELRATLGVDSAAMCARAGDEACGAKARPGRKGRRRAETHTSTQVIAGVKGGGGAWPGFKAQHRATDQRQAPPVWRAPVGGGGAWPGCEIDHSERSSRVAISRAAGPDGARNTSGATQQQHGAWTASGRAGRAAAGDLSGEQATTAGFTRPRGGRPRA